jgi:hypothetical protein
MMIKSKYLFLFNLTFIAFLFSEISLAQNELINISFGRDIADSSIYKSKINVFGSPQIYTDRFGNPCGASYFNGKTDYLKIPNSNLFNQINRRFSVSCWVKIPPNALNWMTLICKGDNPVESINNPHFRVQSFQSNLQSTVSINTEFTEYDLFYSNHLYPINQWFMYTLIYDGLDVNVYINNRLVWNYKYSGNLNINNSDVYICRDIPGSDEYFIGGIDDFRFFDYSIDLSKLNKLYTYSPKLTNQKKYLFNCDTINKYNNDKGFCGARLNFTTPNIHDNCYSGTVKQLAGPPSGSFFSVGQTRIVFKAEMSNLNPQFCNNMIQVYDIEPPVIICPSDTQLIIKNGINSKIDYFFKLPYATDNCKLEKIYELKNKKSGISLSSGSHKFEFEAIDNSGNKSYCSYNVVVKNDSLPSLQNSTIKKSIIKSNSQKIADNCPNDIYLISDDNKCGAIFNFSSDYNLLSGINSSKFLPVGINLVKALNINTNDTCVFNVYVEDREAPRFDNVTDTIIVTNDSSGFNGILPLISVKDNCKLKSINRIGNDSILTYIPIGSSKIEYEAIDIYGNKSILSRNVVVKHNDNLKSPSNNKHLNKKLKSDSLKIERMLDVNLTKLIILMHDSGQEDNDTISVFFNNVEIVNRECIKRLSNKPLMRLIELNGGGADTIYFKAWNNGLIQPNTLQVDVHDPDTFPRNSKRWPNAKPLKSRPIASRPGITTALPVQFKKNK